VSVLTFISRRIRVLGRPRHIIFPPAKPAGFIAKRSRTIIRFRTSRPLLRFFRPKHRIFPTTAPPPPVGFIARPNKLIKVKRRKLYPRPHKVYLFPGAAGPGVITLQRVWRIYLRR
jgi:hypothetical protein